MNCKIYNEVFEVKTTHFEDTNTTLVRYTNNNGKGCVFDLENETIEECCGCTFSEVQEMYIHLRGHIAELA